MTYDDGGDDVGVGVGVGVGVDVDIVDVDVDDGGGDVIVVVVVVSVVLMIAAEAVLGRSEGIDLFFISFESLIFGPIFYICMYVFIGGYVGR